MKKKYKFKLNQKFSSKTEKTEKNCKNSKNLVNIQLKRDPPPLKNIEKIIYNQFKNSYTIDESFYNINIINDIITNSNSHIVAEFKDFLIREDYSEFLQMFYPTSEIMYLLKRILEYYKLSSVVYPNYIILSENRYIYKNIQKKQKVIDLQQEQENNINEKNNGKKEKLEGADKVFDSKVIDSILNQSNTSQLKHSVFGITTESNVDGDDNKLNSLVTNINKAEDNLYNVFLEKNKLVNNVKDDLVQKENIKNVEKERTQKKEGNDVNNNSRNFQHYNELTYFSKTHTYFMPNSINLKCINKGKNVYSIYINKIKQEGLNKKKK